MLRQTKKILFFVVVGLLTFNTICLASNKQIVKIVKASEENDFINSIQNEYIENGTTYKFISYSKTEDEENIKKVILKTEEKTLEAKDELTLENAFENTYNYNDENYEVILDFEEYIIESIDNGYTEEIDTKKIQFKNYSTNDLNNIEKEKKINGYTYVLINVDWKVEDYEDIGINKVPESYIGTANYSRVVRTKNQDTYKVTATYNGNVEKIDKVYKYILNYEEQEKPIEEKKESNIVPIIVITAGISIILVAISMIFRTNGIIYNIEDNKKIKIKKVRVKKGSNIDLTNCKVKGNHFLLKLSVSAYSKLENQEITVSLNSQKIKINIANDNVYFKF